MMIATLHIHNPNAHIITELDINQITGEIITARPVDSQCWLQWRVLNKTYEKGMFLNLQFGDCASLTLKYPVINIFYK